MKPVTVVTFTTALERAEREGLTLRRTARPDYFLVASARRPNTWYEASPWQCGCPAGIRGTFCKHRALVAFAISGGAWEGMSDEDAAPYAVMEESVA
jgi:hypothetical protein